MTDYEKLAKLRKQKEVHDTRPKEEWDNYDWELDERLTKEIAELEEKLKK